jgi:hypothetical protein
MGKRRDVEIVFAAIFCAKIAALLTCFQKQIVCETATRKVTRQRILGSPAARGKRRLYALAPHVGGIKLNSLEPARWRKN